MADKILWFIDFPTEARRQEYIGHFETHQDQQPYKAKFEKEVSSNPFFHPKHRRIRKMKGYPDLYRWQESNTRVIYRPEKPTKVAWVIETSTATGTFYKKRSKR